MNEMRKLMEASTLLESPVGKGRWQIDDSDVLEFSVPYQPVLESNGVFQMELNVQIAKHHMSGSNTEAYLLMKCEEEDTADKLSKILEKSKNKPDFLKRFLGDDAQYFTVRYVDSGHHYGPYIVIMLECDYRHYVVQYAN